MPTLHAIVLVKTAFSIDRHDTLMVVVPVFLIQVVDCISITGGCISVFFKGGGYCLINDFYAHSRSCQMKHLNGIYSIILRRNKRK